MKRSDIPADVWQRLGLLQHESAGRALLTVLAARKVEALAALRVAGSYEQSPQRDFRYAQGFLDGLEYVEGLMGAGGKTAEATAEAPRAKGALAEFEREEP